MSEFRCPKCGGREFGTNAPGGDWDNAEGVCHKYGCQFTWKRSDDEKLGCFIPDKGDLREQIAGLHEELETAKARNTELEGYKKAANFHSLVLMIESNGRHSFFSDDPFMKRQQQNVYRAISEAIDTEQQLDAANAVIKAMLVECAKCNLFFTDEQIQMMKEQATESGI